MLESDTRKRAAPADGVRDSAENSKDDVTECFTKIETFEGEFPHTVDRVSVIWFSYRFFKCHLK